MLPSLVRSPKFKHASLRVSSHVPSYILTSVFLWNTPAAQTYTAANTNPMAHMKDPAAGMPPQLVRTSHIFQGASRKLTNQQLAHMHLISKHRYPVIANPSLEMIVGFLTEAPKIVRDVQPVQWQFLDGPQDGSLFLTWQPLEYLGTTFASDGYVWADAEQPFTSEVQGYKLEIIMHRSGYKATGEALACHSRKRYRLLPSNNGLNLPTPDPALWLVHYTRAATRDQIAAASIPIQPQVQAQLQQRRVIQTTGQLARKEFMLHDRPNWPVISPLPSMAGRPGSGPMVPGAGHRRGGSMNASVGHPTIEEEEDVSRGDALDLVTPREISRMRYEQHHEWMEEVVESPYNIHQIIPSDLGLGRKGELASLTSGFFQTPMSGANPTANGIPTRVGKMDPGKAAEFTKLAAQKVADMQKELVDMKARHARRMERLKRTSVLANAEKKLRTANDGSELGDGDKPDSGASTDEIVRDVEVDWGRKIDRIQNVTVMQRGGIEDPVPRLQSSISARTMSGTSQHRPFGGGSFSQGISGMEARQSPMQQQQSFQQQPQQQSQPMNQSGRLAESAATMVFGQEEIPTITSETQHQPASAGVSAVPTSQSDSQASAGAGAEGANGTSADDDMDMAEDINMDGLDDAGEASADVETADWVMVDENDDQSPGKPQESNQSDSVAPSIPAEQAPSTAPLVQQTPSGEAATQSKEQPAATEVPVIDQQAKEAIPIPPLPTQDSSIGLDSGDLGLGDDFDNVGDMDTAGDALAQYGEEGDDLDLDNMDDSAFGDAFHPPDD